MVWPAVACEAGTDGPEREDIWGLGCKSLASFGCLGLGALGFGVWGLRLREI